MTQLDGDLLVRANELLKLAKVESKREGKESGSIMPPILVPITILIP